MTGPPGPENPKPAKPRLTPDQVLERMIEVQRRLEVDAAFRRPERDPWRRLFWILGGGLAFTTIALLMLQMALSRGSPALLPSPQRSWLGPSTALSLFVVPSGGAIVNRTLRAAVGLTRDLGGDGNTGTITAALVRNL